MSYKSEITHQVGAHTIVVKQLAGFDEYHVFVNGEKSEVFRGNETDPGTNPDLWYTEIGGKVEGSWSTAQDLIADVFLSEDGV